MIARTLIPAIAMLGLLMSACAATAIGDSPSTSPQSLRPAASIPPHATIPPSGEPIVGEVPQPILDAILAHASQQTGVPVGEITVTTGESVVWPNGALGCPQPGMMYTQALVDGYHVVVDADGTELDYRVGSGGEFFICEGRRPGG